MTGFSEPLRKSDTPRRKTEVCLYLCARLFYFNLVFSGVYDIGQ